VSSILKEHDGFVNCATAQRFVQLNTFLNDILHMVSEQTGIQQDGTRVVAEQYLRHTR
jgi:hypothetical protein